MPKKTFFNLNYQKREKIEKAIELELERVSLDNASISKIIREANIPRGSFYQYFEDKEDAIKYIIHKYVLKEKENIEKFLKINDGDIFRTFLDIFDYIFENIKEGQKLNLYRNIFQEIKKNDINIFEREEELEKILEKDGLINTKKLNIIDKKDIKYIIKIISVITRTEALDVSLGKLSKKEAKRQLERQFEILQKGMLKNM